MGAITGYDSLCRKAGGGSTARGNCKGAVSWFLCDSGHLLPKKGSCVRPVFSFWLQKLCRGFYCMDQEAWVILVQETAYRLRRGKHGNFIRYKVGIIGANGPNATRENHIKARLTAAGRCVLYSRYIFIFLYAVWHNVYICSSVLQTAEGIRLSGSPISLRLKTSI